MINYGYNEKGHQVKISDFKLWHRIILFSYPYRYAIIGAILISLLITGGTLALPYLMQTAIDNYIMAADLPAEQRFSGLGKTSLLYGVLIFTVFAAVFLQVNLLEWTGQSIMHNLRQRLFRHLLNLDLPFFNENPTGKLVTRLTNDIQNMNEMFTSIIVTLFNDLLRLAGILVLLCWMNYKLAGLMVLFVPIAFANTVLFARLAREKFRAIRSQLAKLNSFLSETLAGIAIIQLFGQQQRALRNFEQLTQGYVDKTLKQIRIFGFFMPLTEFMSSAAIALILWYGGKEILHQQLTLGELIAFLSYMRLFFQPLRELSQKYSIVQSALASAERIFQLLDTKKAISSPKKNIAQEELTGRIVFDNVSFGYSSEQRILKNVSFTIEPGQTVALVGTTGSGKTTLVNLLLKFYSHQNGEIVLGSRKLEDIPHSQLRNHVGVILQDVFILQDSLYNNIVMDTGKSKEDVEHILRQTGMSRFVQKLPAGLDTLIGDGGQELSTGEKQLLAFARVLCREPDILILDEATAAIDTESENILEQAIEDSFKNRTSLVIAHRLSTIRRADHILVMADGKIIEQGSHSELFAAGGHYARLIEMDLKSSQAELAHHV